MSTVVRRLSCKGLVKWVNKYSGNYLYRLMHTHALKEENICHGVFFSWNNTPRHGVRGYIITEPPKENFMRYADSVKDGTYVFINAWNEWAEGMILEPTEHNGYKYLEWIKEWNDRNR